MPRKRKDLNHREKKEGRREKPIQRNAANARERTRMRVLARAFSRLKTTLPWVPADTKLSKLDTLRLATSYIGHLRTVLTDDSSEATGSKQLGWPFLSLKSPHLPPVTSPTQNNYPLPINSFPPFENPLHGDAHGAATHCATQSFCEGENTYMDCFGYYHQDMVV